VLTGILAAGITLAFTAGAEEAFEDEGEDEGDGAGDGAADAEVDGPGAGVELVFLAAVAGCVEGDVRP